MDLNLRCIDSQDSEDNALSSANSNVNSIIKKGDEILSNNDFFSDLCEIMSDEKVSVFFKKYFTNWTEIKSTVIFMRLFSEISDKYKEINSDDLDHSIIIFIIWKIMRDKNLRPLTIKTIDKHYKNPKDVKNLFSELEKFIATKHNLLELEF